MRALLRTTVFPCFFEGDGCTSCWVDFDAGTAGWVCPNFCGHGRTFSGGWTTNTYVKEDGTSISETITTCRVEGCSDMDGAICSNFNSDWTCSDICPDETFDPEPTTTSNTPTTLDSSAKSDPEDSPGLRSQHTSEPTLEPTTSVTVEPVTASPSTSGLDEHKRHNDTDFIVDQEDGSPHDNNETGSSNETNPDDSALLDHLFFFECDQDYLNVVTCSQMWQSSETQVLDCIDCNKQVLESSQTCGDLRSACASLTCNNCRDKCTEEMLAWMDCEARQSCPGLQCTHTNTTPITTNDNLNDYDDNYRDKGSNEATIAIAVSCVVFLLFAVATAIYVVDCRRQGEEVSSPKSERDAEATGTSTTERLNEDTNLRKEREAMGPKKGEHSNWEGTREEPALVEPPIIRRRIEPAQFGTPVDFWA